LPEPAASQFQYVLPRLEQPALDAMCASLPPLYSGEIGIRLQQVADSMLVNALGA
jgi:cytosine deaminase